MGETDSQALFEKTLNMIVETAKKNKNTISEEEIIKAFETLQLTEEQTDQIYEYLEQKNIDVSRGKAPEEGIDDDDDTVELLIESDDDEDVLIEEVEAEAEKVRSAMFPCSQASRKWSWPDVLKPGTRKPRKPSRRRTCAWSYPSRKNMWAEACLSWT